MSAAFHDLDHAKISMGIETCLKSIQGAEDRFDKIINLKKMDGFEARYLRRMIQGNRKSIERISASFTKNYADQTEVVFSKSSVPVLLLYVAQSRIENTNKTLEEIV